MLASVREWLRLSRGMRGDVSYALATTGAVVGAIASFPQAFASILSGMGPAMRAVEGAGHAELRFVAMTLSVGTCGFVVGQIGGAVAFIAKQRRRRRHPPRER